MRKCRLKAVRPLLPLILLVLISCTPALAQTPSNECADRDLLATYKSASAPYTPSASLQQLRTFVFDLQNAGVAKLLSDNCGLTTSQRLLILNDYGFWRTKIGLPDETAIKALKTVVSLAPKRAAAWLNLGDAYLAARNAEFPIANGPPFRLPTAAEEEARGRRALVAYKRYLALSPSPLRRVYHYVTLVNSNVPPGVGNWTTRDAILHMVGAPHAAATILANDNSSVAQVALAIDLALLLPNPDTHKDEINQLLASSGPYGSPSFGEKAGFDGTAASLLPYVAAYLQFPLACQLVQKFPVLANAADAQFGSSADAFDANIECSDRRFTLPASARALDSDLGGPRGMGDMCGTIVTGIVHHTIFDSDIVTYLPQALLPPYTYLNGRQSGGFPSLGQQEADTLNRAELAPGATPLANWGETDIDSYRKSQKIAADFRKAQTDLATYYRTAFGLSQAKARLAAFHGVWLLKDAYTWAIPGTTDPLAKALLAHEPLSKVQAALKAEAPVPDSTLFLAVEYPEALKLLLAQKPNIMVTTFFGKTVLMEAARYNQLESVKLLLAAGSNVNAASLAPENIPNNSSCTPGGYIIKHGQRTALMYAAANAGLPVIQALLTAGADKTAKDSRGATALDYLEGKGPVARNPVLSAADFKKAQALLATAPAVLRRGIIRTTGTFNLPVKNPAFSRGMPATMYCGNNPESWVRGSASLDLASGKVTIDEQLETDSANAGPTGSVMVYINDKAGRELSGLTTEEIGIAGKGGGNALIRNFRATTTISMEIAQRAASIQVTAVCGPGLMSGNDGKKQVMGVVGDIVNGVRVSITALGSGG